MRSATLVREAKRALIAALPEPVRQWRDAQYYMRYGEVELHLVPFLCRPDRDFIDIGANDGCYVQAAKRYARTIHAFEPLPAMAQILARKFPRGVMIHQMALSRTAGTTILRIPRIDDVAVVGCATLSAEASLQYPGFSEIAVATDTLDHVYDGDAGFIKIDVEGHEEAVLEGGRQTIARCRPRLLIEIDDRLSPGGMPRIAAYFRTLDYRGFFVYRGALLPLERFDKSLMQRPEDLPDLTATLKDRERFSAYIYNFLFLAREEPESLIADLSNCLARLAAKL